jgi:hypothetical protein
MFYLLLIIPHVVALGGLFAFAFYTNTDTPGDEQEDGGDGRDGGQQLPRTPPPAPSGGGLPLSQSSPPRRRLRVGESLAELHPRPPRRDRDPRRPSRTPTSP